MKFWHPPLIEGLRAATAAQSFDEPANVEPRLTAHDKLKKLALLALALCLLLSMGVPAYWLAKRRGLEDMHLILAPRADFYAATISGILSRYEFLPLAVAQSADVAALLRQPAPARVAQVNAYLQEMNSRVGAFAVYVLDPQGVVLASSNWRERSSYVGQNYAFRPYFQQAIDGGIGRFYGIGVSTGEAGLFISQPLRRDGRIIGVVAAKVSLDWIEKSWNAPGVTEQIWVSDANGVVILSSIPGLKYTSLAPLSAQQRSAMARQRQFSNQRLPAAVHPVLQEFADGARVIAVSDPASLPAPPAGSQGQFLAVGRRLAPLDWQITVLTSLTPVHAMARNAVLAAMLAWAALGTGILYARQRRRRIDERLAAQAALTRTHAELELKVWQRTSDLLNANQRLQAEVSERQRAEQTLRCAQAELVQSGKLAAIGQMAAGVTHELNQPLAALQTFSDNARVFIVRGRTAEALENLSTISDLVKRLGYITSQLKAFARRRDDAKNPAHVQKAFAQALLLLHARMAAEHIELQASWPEQPLIVLCSEIGLEQVFTNLLSNAMDAMAPSALRRIEVSSRCSPGQVSMHIADTGPGIEAALIEKIFEPFCSTKERGLGLGLSISTGIIRAADGLLTVRNRAAHEGGGAEFTLKLTPASPA
jgi:two-component system C4-dicarboxylate transport sensor histidine kinase DctB